MAIAAALAGCGGDEDATTDTTGPSATTGPSTTAPEQSTPTTAAEAKELLREKIREAKEKRRQASQEKEEPPPAPIDHDDSGGGSEQFETKGADNSIQQFGSEASDEERSEAAEALHGYLDARLQGRWADACSYFSAQMIASLKQLFRTDKGCAQILASLTARVPPSALARVARADVGSLRSEGDTGFLLYHGAGGEDYAIPMSFEEGAWKVSALEGSVLL